MIRAVEKGELHECARLIRESFMTVAREFGITRENAPRFTAFAADAQRLEWQFADGRPMYVCDEGGICGYYSLHIMGSVCELNNLCVIPAKRHGGIGGKLLMHAADTARAHGCARLEIGIVDENVRLRKWYEHFGAVYDCSRKFDFFPFTCGYMHIDL